MSLRWRIMAAIVFVVLLTVFASVGVGYYATQARLGVFVDEVGGERATQLARNLSREYTDAGGWGTVETSTCGGRVRLQRRVPQRERSRSRRGGTFRGSQPRPGASGRHRRRRISS